MCELYAVNTNNGIYVLDPQQKTFSPADETPRYGAPRGDGNSSAVRARLSSPQLDYLDVRQTDLVPHPKLSQDR